VTENKKRFRIEFTVDVRNEGCGRADWDWRNDDIEKFAIQELDCMSPFPEDITFSEVSNSWHTEKPTEEGWYLLKVKFDDEVIYDTNRLIQCLWGLDWKYAHEEILAWQ